MKRESTTENFELNNNLKLTVLKNGQGVIEAVTFYQHWFWKGNNSTEHRIELKADSCRTLIQGLRDLFPGEAP